MAVTRTAMKNKKVRRKASKIPQHKISRTKEAAEQAIKTGYAPVNGLEMYYDIHGAGEPLILLHGGVGGIEMFGSILPELAKCRQVIAVDFQGHGRTADIDRPLRYESMAEDIAALLKYLGIERAAVMGNSLGGGIALQTAIRYPELVRKLVLVSTVFKQDGWYPEVLAAFAQMAPQSAEFIKQTPLAKLYPNVDWGTLFAKIGELQVRAYDWSQGVAALQMPTLLVFADADAIRPVHILTFYQQLGGGKRDTGLDGSGRSINQLAILPGVTHYTIDSSPKLGATVLPFLNSPLEG